MYDRIMVGYDGSEHSKAALREAAAWIKRHGGSATLVHGVYFNEEEFGAAPVQHEKRIEMGHSICIQAKETVSKEYGMEFESLVCEGEPPEVLVNTARGKKADLIALGTQGRRGIKRLILGSVTSRVIVESPCDVLAVKRPCSDCAGRYSSILVPFDGSPHAKKALTRACQLSNIDGGSVSVLYVVPRYEEMMEFFKTNSINKSLLEEAEKIVETARGIAASLGVTVRTLVKEGPASYTIIEAAKENKSEVIVMGSHGWRGINRALMGSTTERVIMTANCPVLVAR